MSHPDPVTPLHSVPETGQTALSLALGQQSPLLAAPQLTLHCGAKTPRLFDQPAKELDSLLNSAGISDLGWRGKLQVTGSDRLRWLNGMVSNTVQSLPEGQGNYSFFLSVQGRIQGDGYVYRRATDLLLDTGRDQVQPLMRHLEHFIIMDDVELTDVSRQWTALSLAGPATPRVLAVLGLAPATTGRESARMTEVRIGEVDCSLIEVRPVTVPRFELWMAPQQVLEVWETLLAAGAFPCGLEATEALRVLEATPLYGVDLNDRDLPQETAQYHALNFNKGCYLGQEIVERIRSRGKVNRQFRPFVLQGSRPHTLPADLLSAGQSVGRITSAASFTSAGLPPTLALGFIRLEVLDRNAEIAYDGGAATALGAPLAVAPPVNSAN